MKGTPGISVVICCYNSSKRIKDTLSYLAKQNFSENIPWEVVIVDNNSTDLTIEVVRKIWPEIGDHIPLSICYESLPGLSNARKTGVDSAHFEYIVFCDDDNWLDSSYLQNAFQIITTDKSIGALGGWSKPVFEANVNEPDWFDEVKNSYAVGEQAPNSGDVSKRGYLWGAGLVLRKSLFKIISDEKFPLLLSGRKGAQLSAGDDSEMCLRLVMLGYRLHYDSRLFYYHFIPAERLSDKYREGIFKGFEATGPIINKYHFFIDNYARNRNRWPTKIKWGIKYWLISLGVIKNANTSFQNRMLSAFTNYSNEHLDHDIKSMRLFFDNNYRKGDR